MSVRHCVPDEAVEAANAALAEERRLPVSSMRAAILAAQPVMAEQLQGAVEALREIAERTDVPADFANAVVRLRWVHERATNALGGQ